MAGPAGDDRTTAIVKRGPRGYKIRRCEVRGRKGLPVKDPHSECKECAKCSTIASFHATAIGH